MSNKKLFHYFDVEGRQVTMCVKVIDTLTFNTTDTEAVVTVGVSVCVPEDTYDAELGRKIAEGRTTKNFYKMNFVNQDIVNHTVLKGIAQSYERAIRKDVSQIGIYKK